MFVKVVFPPIFLKILTMFTCQTKEIITIINCQIKDDMTFIKTYKH